MWVGSVCGGGGDWKEFWRKTDCCRHGNKGTPPFLSGVAHPSTCGRDECQPYQKNPDTWPGGERGRRPQCLKCGLASFLLSFFLFFSSVWDFISFYFCSIWVGSKCLPTSPGSESRCPLWPPSSQISKGRKWTRKVQFHSNAVQCIWWKQKQIVCTYV